MDLLTSLPSGARPRAVPRSCTWVRSPDTAGSPEQIMAVNILGTWHVLLAAEATGVTRAIYVQRAGSTPRASAA
jgi:nucleoside-diphosphate-sugar epimerase